jgi:predicted transcriptional regulator
MTTLKVGIVNYEEMKARTVRIAKGKEKSAGGTPKVWFTSTESFAKILSADNRALLRIIDEHAPGSLEDLSQITGRAKSNLSRAIKTMANYGLVRMEKGQGRKLIPKVACDTVELVLPLTAGKASRRVAADRR